MEARNRAFKQLKPVCVKLSDSALKLMGRDGSTQDVIDDLQALQRVLRLVAAQENVLDTKLADYVFFPLSSALKQLEKLPVRGKESLFACLYVLLQTAWAKDLSPELGMQLLILYSFVADQKGLKTSEELQALVFQSMGSVLRSLTHDDDRRQALLAAKTIPHIGKALSVILDGCVDAPSEQVQVAAIEALDAFCHAVQDREAIGISFLPGIMSSLTKVLSFQSSARTNSKALVMALDTLTFLLPYVFSDDLTRDLASGDVSPVKGLTTSWLKATTAQIRMSLGTIMKLQQYDRQNVRLALSRLCCELLQKCPIALKDCVTMLLEALLTIAGFDAGAEAELRHLLGLKSSFGDTLRSSLHYWIISLPRIMQSADDTKKQRRINQIATSFKILSEQGFDLAIIHQDLAANLRGSVTLTIMERTHAPSVSTIEARTTALDLIMEYDRQSDRFGEVMSLQKGQQNTLKELLALVSELSRDGRALDTARDLALSVANMSGQQQLASFWLSLNILRNSLTPGAEIEEFIRFPDDSTRGSREILEQLYDFSISLLGETSLASQADWRLRALALETLALQASRLKVDFRGELIDALYPILHHLGANEQLLQKHAITCLNIVASECGYRSSGEMIIDNIDYLVNAVALRLNTFDISPQAPQVLLMMVRLAGPSVLPYLDDTVESIFVALESFHGYPKLVDLLFSVLKVIVEEGAKSSQLAITHGNPADDRRKSRQRIPTIEEVVQEVHRLCEKYKEDIDDSSGEKGHPERSWKTDKPVSPGEEGAASIEGEGEETQPPAPRTYAMLLNISRLTQHYLTSSSPQLRTSLLDLLTSSFPALAKHENSFLPLINTLWPVLLPRLEEPEPYVVAGSLEVIGIICRYAGDFMSSRIEEVWPTLKRLYKTRARRAVDRARGAAQVTAAAKADITSIVSSDRSSDAKSQPLDKYYVDAPSRIIWEALVTALTDIIAHTATNDVLFDEVLDMLVPLLDSRPEVRKALEIRNADAVWLALFRRRAIELARGSEPDDGSARVQQRQPMAGSRYPFAALV